MLTAGLPDAGARMVPVAPLRDEAREWLTAELAKGRYREAEPTVVDRVITAVMEWLARLISDFKPLDAGPGTLLLAAGTVLVLVVVVLLVKPRLNTRRRQAQPGVFDEGDVRTAAEHRRLASVAAGASNWNGALTERLRAVIRSAEERGIIDDQPGRTAGEAAVQLDQAFGTSADGIMWLAARFNEVHYGNLPADGSDYRRAEHLDNAMLRARTAAGRSTDRWVVPQ